MFTKQHADENRRMAAFAERLTDGGITESTELMRRLQDEFPAVPPHRIRRAAAIALARWRGRKYKKVL